MMKSQKQPTLRPSDVVVACQLAITQDAKYLDIADFTGISAGECHNAVRRLRLARILLAGERRPAAEVLHLFLVQGVPFAFPPVVGIQTIGTATAISAEVFRGKVDSPDGFVWPDAAGSARGQSLIPLFPGAPSLPARNQPLYDLLAIVDALRIGTSRVRAIASELLAERLRVPKA
jgi:hypothetical protein